MKYQLLFSFLGIVNIVFAQSHFLDHRHEWTESYQCFGSQSTETNRFTIDATPIEINGEAYNEIMVSATPSGDNFTGTGNFLRTDDSNRVFSYNGITTKLEYDFNLILGDTFQTNNDFDCEIIVGSIGTITLLNGEERRKWVFYYSGEEYHPEYKSSYPFWIEGIGSNWGILGNASHCQIDGCGSSLLCVNFDGLLIYESNNFLDTCWITISSTLKPNSEQINIYPNPATYSIEISDPELIAQRIYILNPEGKVVSKLLDSNNQIDYLLSGYYIIRIDLKNGGSEFRSFIKI